MTGISPAAALLNDSERRATVRAFQFWLDLAAPERTPTLGDIGEPALDDEWANRFILAVDSQAELSVFLICGPEVVQAFGNAVVNRTILDAVPPNLLAPFADACASAVARREPSAHEGAFLSPVGIERRCRGIFLPLDSVHAPARYVFGAFSCQTLH